MRIDNWVALAASRDETRPFLCHVRLIMLRGELCVVASDGHRTHIAPAGAAMNGGPESIEARGVRVAIERALDECDIELGDVLAPAARRAVEAARGRAKLDYDRALESARAQAHPRKTLRPYEKPARQPPVVRIGSRAYNGEYVADALRGIRSPLALTAALEGRKQWDPVVLRRPEVGVAIIMPYRASAQELAAMPQLAEAGLRQR